MCRTMSLAAREHLRVQGELPTDEDVRAWIDAIRDRIYHAASQRRKTPRDFAATMILIMTDGRRTLIAQVGDGCAVLKEAGAAEWRIPLWPDHGEYASTTAFVTDDPEPKCRIVRDDAEISVFAALTDGLERLALDFSSQTPSGGFFDGVARPVCASAAHGKDVPLSLMLKQLTREQLQGWVVNRFYYQISIPLKDAAPPPSSSFAPDCSRRG